MNYAGAWFLIMISTQQYIGPISQPNCQQAAAALVSEGIVCRPMMMKVCPVPDSPGSYTSCPVFDLPQVTVKP